MLSTDPYTHTDKTQPNSPSSSSLFGESVLENFTLQTNFLRRQQNLQEQQQRNKRKRKESSFSSCSSSSSASLLSLVPNTERRPSSVAPSTVVGGVGEENPFVVGDSATVREEQCAQRKSEKSLSSCRSADLNECSPCSSRPRDSSNRSMRQQEVPDGGDDEHDSPRRKRPKYDYTRDQMFEIFQPWVIRTYGDRAKTKTITLKKQARIIRALKGQEMNNPDSSKFRFWVKTKGFTTNKPEGFQNIFAFHDQEENDGCLLYAPNTVETDSQPFKKVAVVENFFNIIYGVHVSLGSRSSRHAGQKRTYRTITETYAFLPREAVTKFLSLCSQCSKALRPPSPIKLDHADSPLTSKTDESFDRGTKEFSEPKRVSTPLQHSFSNGSSSFDRLNSDEVYSKLLDYYKVQNEESDGATYYQLLKTFYDNVKKNRAVESVKDNAREAKQQKLEPVVDLTGMSESDKTAEINFSNVSKKSVPSSENCALTENEKVLRANFAEDGGECSIDEKELHICEEASEDSEKMRLNNNLDDKFNGSDGDSDVEQVGNNSRPITSTYLELTRSMGVADDDALNMVSMSRLLVSRRPVSEVASNLNDASLDTHKTGRVVVGGREQFLGKAPDAQMTMEMHENLCSLKEVLRQSSKRVCAPGDNDVGVEKRYFSKAGMPHHEFRKSVSRKLGATRSSVLDWQKITPWRPRRTPHSKNRKGLTHQMMLVYVMVTVDDLSTGSTHSLGIVDGDPMNGGASLTMAFHTPMRWRLLCRAGRLTNRRVDRVHVEIP
ncbi:uncharacterized protein LOC135698569 [Ochlerotatus camptorhynchus]|uniref:uncharacterized protein LOC135698569 n=1 Tax=Ochlerotatus camptorhynchus TaxID=644619 RepID=UPI0031D8182C